MERRGFLAMLAGLAVVRPRRAWLESEGHARTVVRNCATGAWLTSGGKWTTTAEEVSEALRHNTKGLRTMVEQVAIRAAGRR